MGGWVKGSFILKNIDMRDIQAFLLSSQSIFRSGGGCVGGWGRVLTKLFRFVKIINNAG